MDRAWIRTPWWLSSLLWLPLVGAALGWAYSRLSLGTGLLLALTHHFAWKGAALAAFHLGSWRVEMLAMLLLGALVYACSFALRWRLMRRMLGLVKSETITRALEADPGMAALVGQKRSLTVLFADIRGFTACSEQHPPEIIVALLNDYFSAVLPVLEAEGGTINQFMGDGVMVLFGAPTWQADHAARAVRAARRMLAVVRRQRQHWCRRLGKDFSWPDTDHPNELRIGIGINSGEAVVGCVGSPRRLDYSAIGDMVNTAARIESANKELKTEILVGEATFAALTPEQRRELGCSAESRAISVHNKVALLLVNEVRVE